MPLRNKNNPRPEKPKNTKKKPTNKNKKVEQKKANQNPAPEEEMRQPGNFAVIGTTGSGKSTLAIKEAKRMDNKILVCTWNFEPEIWDNYPKISLADPKQIQYNKGVKICSIGELGEKESFKQLDKFYRDGVIIWDDCKQYIPNRYDKYKEFKNLVIATRHKGLDSIFIVHQPEEIPPRLWGFIKVAHVGYCSTELTKIRAAESKKFFWAIEQVRKRVKAKAKQGIPRPHAGEFITILLSYF